jgi:hypothetical protein
MQIDQKVVANYLNSKSSDQQLKNGMMLATIKMLIEKQEQTDKKIKELEGDIKCCQLEMTFCQCRPKDEAETK